MYRRMTFRLPCITLAACIFLHPSAADADLPCLKKQPWIGYFIGMETKKKFRFGVTAKGQGVLSPLKSDGEPVYMNDPIQINFDVLETTPEGKIIRKQFQSDSLATDQEACEDPNGPVTFRGKVTGNATFEVTVIPERGGFSVSGRLTDKGTITNPLHFEISTDFTPYVSKPGDEDSEIKRFQKRAKKDILRYETVSQKREKLEFLEEANPATTVAEALSSAQIETDGYGGIEIALQTSEKSKLTFDDKGSRPLWKGFTLRWKVDDGVDSATQKLTITSR